VHSLTGDKEDADKKDSGKESGDKDEKHKG
jgi:hypothetical protein